MLGRPFRFAWPATYPMASRSGQYAGAHGHMVMTSFPHSLRVLDERCAFSACRRDLAWSRYWAERPSRVCGPAMPVWAVLAACAAPNRVMCPTAPDRAQLTKVRFWLPSVSRGWLFPPRKCAPVLAVVKQTALDDGCGPAWTGGAGSKLKNGPACWHRLVDGGSGK